MRGPCASPLRGLAGESYLTQSAKSVRFSRFCSPNGGFQETRKAVRQLRQLTDQYLRNAMPAAALRFGAGQPHKRAPHDQLRAGQPFGNAATATWAVAVGTGAISA